MPEWKTQYDGVETMTLAVMGCVVNGPGESKAANIGISLPGTGEAPNCPIYIDGEHVTTLRGTYEELAAAFQRLVDDYVETRSTPDADLDVHDVRPGALSIASGASSSFRPLQREAMHAILDRRDSVVVLPTGGGKSLCFQAPALVDPSCSDQPAGTSLRCRRRSVGSDAAPRLRPGRLAAHLADEGSGRRPARRRRRRRRI